MRWTPSSMSSSDERERQARVPGRAEGLAGDDRDLGLVEQHLGELDRVARRPPRDLAAEHALEGREAVEGALRLDAGHARDRREQLVHATAAPFERRRASPPRPRGRRAARRAPPAATRCRRSTSSATGG